MPDAFFYPEHWQAVFTGKLPRTLGRLLAGRGRR